MDLDRLWHYLTQPMSTHKKNPRIDFDSLGSEPSLDSFLLSKKQNILYVQMHTEGDIFNVSLLNFTVDYEFKINLHIIKKMV